MAAEVDLDRYAHFFRASPDLLCLLGFDGYLKELNPNWEAVTGFSRHELLVKPVAEFIQEEDRAEAVRVLAALSQGGRIDGLENRFVCKDGGRKWLRWHAVAVPAEGMIYAVVCDVTESRKADQEVFRAKEEWERTFDTVPDLIAVMDRDSRILRVNKALTARMGLSADQCVGRHCYEIFHGLPYEPDYCPHAMTNADGQEHIAETYDERLGAYFLRSVSPYRDAQGRMIGVVEVMRDISELKRIEREAAEASRLKSDLISLINHEYANALTAMKLAVAVLKAAESGSEPIRLHSYRMLEKSIESLRSYTANFLGLHRLESGEFKLRFRPIALPALIKETAEEMRPLIEAKRLRLSLSVDIPDSPPMAARADQECLSVILRNLISNAIKYTPNGGAIVIRVALGGDPARVEVSVEDNGIGIPAEDVEKITARFYRTKEGRETAQGFGVGLSVVAELLARHGSRLEIESEPGQGSKFSFGLPVWDPGRA